MVGNSMCLAMSPHCSQTEYMLMPGVALPASGKPTPLPQNSKRMPSQKVGKLHAKRLTPTAA